MNKNEFLRKLEEKAPPHLRGSFALKLAADLKEKDKGSEFYNSDIPDTIENAGIINHSYQVPEKKNKKFWEINKLSHQDLITSDYLIEQIAIWVESVRKELFNTIEIPFPKDIPSAVAWIKAETNKPRPKDIQTKINKFYQEINRLEEKRKKGLIIGSYSLERSFLDYPGDQGWVESVLVDGREDLEKLQREVARMSKTTGFKESALTIHILTGLKPLIPRTTIKASLFPGEIPKHLAIMPDGTQLRRNYMTIEINAADLTSGELKSIYDGYRRSLNIKKKKSINEDQFRLYHLVKSKGGPPSKKGTTKFWQDIQKEWNSIPSNKKYTTWEGPYTAYKRMIEDLDHQFKGTGKDGR